MSKGPLVFEKAACAGQGHKRVVRVCTVSYALRVNSRLSYTVRVFMGQPVADAPGRPVNCLYDLQVFHTAEATTKFMTTCGWTLNAKASKTLAHKLAGKGSRSNVE